MFFNLIGFFSLRIKEKLNNFDKLDINILYVKCKFKKKFLRINMKFNVENCSSFIRIMAIFRK